MAIFRDLPNEVVSQVVAFVLPEDLENFAQTCWRVQRESTPFLIEHRSLIQKHSLLSNEPNAYKLRELLRDVLLNPRLGHYVRRFELRGSHDPTQQRLPRQAMDAFCQAAALGEILARADEPWPSPEYWANFLQISDDMFIPRSLLPLLPNPNTLSWELQQHGLPSVLTSLFNQAAAKPASKLPKVHTIYLVPWKHSGNGRIGCELEHLRNTASLPSLKRLFAAGAWDVRVPEQAILGDVHALRNIVEGSYTSNVTTLVLWDSRIRLVSLEHFISSFKHLRNFHYSAASPPSKPWRPNRVHSAESMWLVHNPPFIKTALACHAKDTLRSLTLLVPKQPKEFMGSLCEFRVLKDIFLDWHCLGLNLHEGKLALWEVLPQSLESLGIHDDEGHREYRYKEITDKVITAKAETVKYLKLLKFQGEAIPHFTPLVMSQLTHQCFYAQISLVLSRIIPTMDDLDESVI